MKHNDLNLNIPRPGDTAPFKLPDNYFRQLTDDIQAGIAEDERESELHIKGLTKAMPFKIPEAYFEGLSVSIIQRIENEKAKEIKLIPMRRNSWYKSGIAACLTAGLIGFGLYTHRNTVIEEERMLMNTMLNDGTYFEEGMLIDEALHVKHFNQSYQTDKTGSQEDIYILNNIDEDILLQEL